MPVNIFSVSSAKQDVKVLLDNVAEAVHRWEGGGAPALDLSMMLDEAGKVGQRARRLKEQWNVDGRAVIQSTRPGLGPWVIRFQNLVRKLTWWYLEPVIQQIRVFQMNAALAAGGLAQNQERLLARHEDLLAELAMLQKRVEALEAQALTTGGNMSSDAGD